ncbi:class I SAM-dependent methyltransferase [Paenibacillus sp. 1781tsa1]|uniref:class I SAM-dependent methyltransferase n=1 Tax=Paenibacillus sp. 1781tsa1 TaxID=2953810 RepID=UPI00209E610F|nr:class I SAM-dependent methyltransferase [Paenibacillus sp. 1781tsa1]MCP1183839.1 class I SAM-dependent methyltransferase [Paenibacillus sp. 1781tsa1]
MLHSLMAIQSYKSGNTPEAQQPWLQLLAAAEQPHINLERIHSIAELEGTNPVLDYTERTLHVLEKLQVSFWVREILEEVLIWSETAKAGSREQRRVWQKQGVNLFVHNVGSAQLYDLYIGANHLDNDIGKSGGTSINQPGSLSDALSKNADMSKHAVLTSHTPRHEVIRTLIATHGLIGQYIRGEIPFAENAPLHALIVKGWLTTDELHTILLALNECIIAGVDPALWVQVQAEVQRIVGWIITGPDHEDWSVKERLSRLRSSSIRQGEAVDTAYAKLQTELNVEQALAPLAHRTLWYVESAMQDFSLQEMVKVFLLTLRSESMTPTSIEKQSDIVRHISFEPLMNTMYYDYKGVKKLNIYKKRMIEKYLEQYAWEQIVAGEQIVYPHLTHRTERHVDLPDTLFVTFEFSPAAEKLIAFCIEAEKSPLYEKAVLLLFDLFGLRRDAYDRFHNEETYLSDMNSSGDYKKVLLDYIVGKRVLDIGPGGGILLDLIEQEKPEVEPIGIDISANVIEALERKKQREGHRWQVMKGDALQLEQYVQPGTVDTVIFSSILHELYSYIELDGRRFNSDTVVAALRSSFRVLSPGGRILIRDGIMSEPEAQKRRIRFLELDGMRWLERYAEDFQGRAIKYERISDNEVVMPINDAMEFLYTYTWGEEAYVHEIQEQFGIFTPTDYKNCILEALGEQAEMMTFEHFLQEGYTEALGERIIFMKEDGSPAPLPDSTCLIVIEKKKGLANA